MPVHAISPKERPSSRESVSRRTGKEPHAYTGAVKKAQRARETIPTGAGTYTVRPGDTLYGIARELKATGVLTRSPEQTVRELTEMNRLPNPDRIYPGQQLRLPAPSQHVPSLPETETRDIRSFATSLPPVPQQATLPEKPPWAGQLSEDFLSDFAGPACRIPGTASVPPPEPDLEAQVAMYKTDQLLAHPGGDYYFLNRSTMVHDPAFDQSNFANRVGKDLADAGENLLNIAKDLTLGSSFKYVGKDGTIRDGQRTGVLGAVKNFFEDLISGLTFGAYVPEGEKAPEGAGASLWHFIKKVFYEAPVRDLLVGLPHAGINIVKDAAFAALNLLEVIPDATIGNVEWGQKLTTTIFDNGQVVIDYLTDVVPTGSAWLRVHAAGPTGQIAPPVFYNLETSGKGVEDSRWATVRNTPFRKTIETLGSLLSDAAAIAVIANQPRVSADQRHP